MVQVKSVLVKTNSSVKVLVEDTLRYNTFRDPTGFGLFTAPGPVVIFQINELGHPMLDPVPGTCSTDFFSNVQSRFQYMNPLTNYILEQAGHNFEKGDAICIEAGQFELSDVDNVDHFIGTVVFPGPGPDQFILRPANGIIDFVPGLPGNVGEYIYPSIDGTGDLTTDAASARPIFMKIADAIATSSYGDGIDPSGNDGDIIEINKTQLTLLSGNGTYDIDDAVGIINSQTSAHNITALKTNAPTEVASDTAGNNTDRAFSIGVISAPPAIYWFRGSSQGGSGTRAGTSWSHTGYNPNASGGGNANSDRLRVYGNGTGGTYAGFHHFLYSNPIAIPTGHDKAQIYISSIYTNLSLIHI